MFVADKPLPEIAMLPIDASLAFFDTLALPGWRGEIATKIVKEIRERLGFLNERPQRGAGPAGIANVQLQLHKRFGAAGWIHPYFLDIGGNSTAAYLSRSIAGAA